MFSLASLRAAVRKVNSAAVFRGIIGLVTMGRPPLPKGERRKQVTFTLGVSEIDALKELSRLRGRPQSQIIGQYALAALVREKRKS